MVSGVAGARGVGSPAPPATRGLCCRSHSHTPRAPHPQDGIMLAAVLAVFWALAQAWAQLDKLGL